MRPLVAALALWIALPAAAQAPERPDPARLMAAQREAMAKLAFLDGLWRGTARVGPPGSGGRDLVQTERVGTTLGGTVRVIEGRGYDESGRTLFRSFGLVAFDPSSGRFTLRAHADGQQSDFPFEVDAGGYAWEVPAGPGRVRYRAQVADGRWRQTGELLLPDRPPVRVFEMDLRRIGDTDWPAAGEVGPR